MAVNESTGFISARNGGQSFASIFMNGCIEVRTGGQPGTADDAATGDLVARITRDGGGWAPGSPANGLQFFHSGRFVLKQSNHAWVLTGLDAGVAGWFRLVGNAPDDGAASITLPRIDGTIALDGAPADDAQMFFPAIDITPTTAIQIPEWWYANPPI